MKDQSVMYLMARAAKLAGAKMIRTSSVRDIVEIKEDMRLQLKSLKNGVGNINIAIICVKKVIDRK